MHKTTRKEHRYKELYRNAKSLETLTLRQTVVERQKEDRLPPIDDSLLGANSRQPDDPFELPILQDRGD